MPRYYSSSLIVLEHNTLPGIVEHELFVEFDFGYETPQFCIYIDL